MKRNICAIAFGFSTLLSTTSIMLAADQTEIVRFAAGASSATVSGKIKGYDGVNYLLDARAGQLMHVLFSPKHNACYFNVYAPGAEAAMHRGEVDGNEFSVRLSESGQQRVQVYLMRSAARRNETCKFKLSFEISSGGSDSASMPAGHAPSAEYMMEDCKNSSQIFFQEFQARSDVKYEGQRVDGTHAVNGTIYLETRSEDFQCSYNRAGETMVGFFAEGKSWPDFVRGNGSPHMRSGVGSQSESVDMGDLRGMDSIKAFDAMTSRGFTNVDTITSGNTIYGIYYNSATRQCIQITNADNKVYEVTDIQTHPKCR